MKKFLAVLVLTLVVGGFLAAIVATSGWAVALGLLLLLVVLLGVVFTVLWAILVLMEEA